MPGHLQHLPQFGPGGRRHGGPEGLHHAEMVDDEARLRMAVDEGRDRGQGAPALQVDGQPAVGGRTGDAGDAGVLRIEIGADEEPNTDRAGRAFPVRDHLRGSRIGRIQRFDQAEAPGMGALHLHCIARVVAVHREGRHDDCAIDPHSIHGRHHLVAGDMRRPEARYVVPGPRQRVRFVSVNLRIYNRPHGHHLRRA